MTSAIHTDFLQGFMQVFKNKKDTVSYDNSPSNSTRQDASGNTLYTMAYEFSEEMLYGDSLDCRWTREDGNVLESETKFVIEFCKSLEPPTSFDIKLTSEAPETNTTMDTITERQGNNWIIILCVSISVLAIVLLAFGLVCCYRYQRRSRNSFPSEDMELQSPEPQAGLSDDDEGLEGSPNHATTETSSHLSPSDSSPLVGNCLNPISETETGSRPTSEILDETENNVSPRRNTSIDKEFQSPEQHEVQCRRQRSFPAKKTEIRRIIDDWPTDLEQINEFVCGQNMLDLSRSLGDSWWMLGLRLGLTYACLENIEYDHHKDQEAQGFQMLLEWTKRQEATKSKLCQAVEQLDT
ncbi:uncharacterized protein LOC134187002 [Corticium candelabrum]|uniref:uncharacterized protein LOC134187002 n=1 Tax=Corticium candelabrum TaxID=121492 RepID=UPI002E270E02|nr:uncharacterized protein LOC134187002 [Corticium candelabrum]